MISPLKLGGVEAEQMLWFRERGLRVGLGTLASAGLTAPITPAGAIALHISERVFINLVNLVLYGIDDFSLGCALSMADMRTAAFQYGRPEQVLMNSAMSDIADFYGMCFQDHGGLTDAKLPSFEAGLQKTATALSSVMKGRNGYFAAGLLSIDEVFSPVQMVLDNEAAGYLQRICRGFGCTDDDIGVQAVLDCTKEGLLFMMHEHTAEHMREAAWNPTVFSREMLGQYHDNGGIDAERAREIALSIMAGPELERRISEDCDNAIRHLINND